MAAATSGDGGGVASAVGGRAGGAGGGGVGGCGIGGCGVGGGGVGGGDAEMTGSPETRVQGDLSPMCSSAAVLASPEKRRYSGVE